jgi:hypothetical protein
MLEPVGDGAVASRSHSGRSDESESEGLRQACRSGLMCNEVRGEDACGYGSVVVLSAL